MLDCRFYACSSICLSGFLLISAGVSSLAAVEVTRGPYLQMATPQSVVLVWRTDAPITPEVRFGESLDALTNRVGGAQITRRVSVDVAAAEATPYDEAVILYDEPFRGSSERPLWERNPSTRPDTYQYEAHIDGLAANAKAFYAIYDQDVLLAGGDADHYFKTSPQRGDTSDLRIWVVGDSGTGGVAQRRVFEAMQTYAQRTSRSPDLYVHVGDMAYGDGADVEFQKNFFDVYQPLLRNTVCWPTMGNHEGHTSRGISQFGPYYDAYVLPIAAEAGGLASGTEAYYSFDVADVHFVCLDSHDLDRSPEGAMAQWLALDLEETDQHWLIAFWHHPPYTKGSHDSDAEGQLIEMRTHIMPLLEAGGVDLVLSGHSHIYERSMLIDGAYQTPTTADGVILDDGDGRPDGDGAYRKSQGLTPHNGTVAIVSGHGGAGVSRKGTMPIMREIIVDHGSLLLDIQGNTLTGIMVDDQAEQRDRFQLIKQGTVDHIVVEDPWQPEQDPSLITEMLISWSAKDVGSFPEDWRVINGSSERMSIEKAFQDAYHVASIGVGEEAYLVVYDSFSGRVSELQSYIYFPDGADAAAGLVFACQDANNYFRYSLDPKRQTATMTRVVDGVAKTVGERKVDLDFTRPVKVELEPVEQIVEVQLNDDVEYTVQLGETPSPGQIGVCVDEGGALMFGGLTIEKAK